MNQQVLSYRGAKTFSGLGFWTLFAATTLALLSAEILDSGLTIDQLRGFYSNMDASGIDPEIVASLLMQFVLSVVVVLLLFIWVRLAVKARILIDPHGIRFESRLPQLLEPLRPNWHYRWSEITGAALGKKGLGNHLQRQLTLTAGGSVYTLIPWQWVDENEKSSLFEFTLPGKKAEMALRKTPLVSLFEDRGLLTDGPVNAKQSDGFDGKPTVRVVAALFITLVAYFVIDQYFGVEEMYAATPPYHWMVSIGIAAGAIAYLILPNEPHYAARSTLVAVLLGAGVAFAMHPMLLRANAWTDESGIQTHDYVLGEGSRWMAASNGDLPELFFGTKSAYWRQYRPGDHKTFEIRIGGLGLYQVNMAPIYEEQRAFFEVAAR